MSPQVAMPACRTLLTSSGWRVRIAKMPPTNAYTAQTKASRSANEPNTSTYNQPSPVARSILAIDFNSGTRQRWERYQARHIVLAGCAESDPFSADFAGGPAVGAASYLDAHFA